jgi:phosphoserine phosphatase RsbU/P
MKKRERTGSDLGSPIKKKWHLSISIHMAGHVVEPKGRTGENQRASRKPAPTILIVDDTPTNVELVESILATEGFATLVAGDGAEAFAVGRSQQPDLILLDVMMPGETGYETCARLKSDPATSDIPIIFLSALDDVQSKVMGLKTGGVDYISKPVHGAEVLARVRVHLRIRETNRLLAQQNRDRIQRLQDAQRAILLRPADYPEASFAVFYEPLEEAGGDFYDVVAIDSEVSGYFVADVSGHGVQAAFVTSAIKALFHQYSGPMFSPEDTMRGIDSVMRHVLSDEQYLTACHALLNRRSHQLSIVSAGHPPAIVARKSGKVETIQMDGEPLGVFHSVVLQRKDLRVGLGDRVFLYTDGLVESAPGARSAGTERLMAAAVRRLATPLEQAVKDMAADCGFPGSAAQDDLLLLAVEVGR